MRSYCTLWPGVFVTAIMWICCLFVVFVCFCSAASGSCTTVHLVLHSYKDPPEYWMCILQMEIKYYIPKWSSLFSECSSFSVISCTWWCVSLCVYMLFVVLSTVGVSCALWARCLSFFFFFAYLPPRTLQVVWSQDKTQVCLFWQSLKYCFVACQLNPKWQHVRAPICCTVSANV